MAVVGGGAAGTAAAVGAAQAGGRTALFVASRPVTSQPDHAFPEPGGTKRSRWDSVEVAIEFGRVLAEPWLVRTGAPAHSRITNCSRFTLRDAALAEFLNGE